MSYFWSCLYLIAELINGVETLHCPRSILGRRNSIPLLCMEVEVDDPKALLNGVLILFNFDLPTEDQPTGLGMFVPREPTLLFGFIFSVLHIEAERSASISLFPSRLGLRFWIGGVRNVFLRHYLLSLTDDGAFCGSVLSPIVHFDAMSMTAIAAAIAKISIVLIYFAPLIFQAAPLSRTRWSSVLHSPVRAS
jgi:hypothetical protein